MNIIQIIVVISNIISLFLVNCKSSRKRLIAAIIGLATQPLWFIIAVYYGVWANIILACVFTFSWGFGIFNNINRDKKIYKEWEAIYQRSNIR